MLRTYVFQCSFHAGCWKYTLSHHRGPCGPQPWKSPFKASEAGHDLSLLSRVYLAFPLCPLREYTGQEDCSSLLKVQIIEICPWLRTWNIYIVFLFFFYQNLGWICSIRVSCNPNFWLDFWRHFPFLLVSPSNSQTGLDVCSCQIVSSEAKT